MSKFLPSRPNTLPNLRPWNQRFTLLARHWLYVSSFFLSLSLYLILTTRYFKMAQLYKWSTDEQVDQLKQFLAYNGPTTASLLGYILSTGECESDAPGKSVIWTSHADPFHTTDIVVWIIDSDHRIRFFVTSEIELNFKEMTPDAAILAHKASYPDELPAYFTHAEDEALYKRSLQVVEAFLTLYMDTRYGADKGKTLLVIACVHLTLTLLKKRCAVSWYMSLMGSHLPQIVHNQHWYTLLCLF